MMEVGVLVDSAGNALHWHLPPGRHSAALPDSRDLWDVFWTNRDNISGFAHSHPGHGVPAPSHTDITTFAAIEAALGKRLSWWIITADHVGVFFHPGGDAPSLQYARLLLPADPPWVAELRRLTGY